MWKIYNPSDVHERAHHAISEVRTGIMSNEDDIARINRIISSLVKNGQSLHQIYLPRKVKYRPRYKKPGCSPVAAENIILKPKLLKK